MDWLKTKLLRFVADWISALIHIVILSARFCGRLLGPSVNPTDVSKALVHGLHEVCPRKRLVEKDFTVPREVLSVDE